MVYGAVMVLSILMAVGYVVESPLETGIVLFGSVFAIVCAETFAETLSTPLESDTAPTLPDLRAAWHHSRDTLIAANIPTCLFIAAWFGLITPAFALVGSQFFATSLLALVGARVGWRSTGSILWSSVSAVCAGSVGVLLAALKYVIH